MRVLKSDRDPYMKNMETAYRTNRKCKRRMLWTIYAETERSLKIHAQQLCAHLPPDGKAYAKVQEEYETCLTELSAYKRQLELLTKSDKKSKSRISEVKAIKFEPLMCGDAAVNCNSNNNTRGQSDNVLGYLVKYDINDMCGNVSPTDSLKQPHPTYSDHDLADKRVIKKALTSFDTNNTDLNLHIVESRVSLNSLLSIVSVPERRRLQLEQVASRDDSGISSTGSSQPSLLWQSNSNLDCRKSISTESHTANSSTFPEGVTFLRNGELVVADTSQGQLQIFDRTGATVKVITQDKVHRLLGDWKFKPQCVATNLAVSNDVWVTDAQDKCIKLFNYDSGRCMRNIPLLSYSMPYGLAILPNGHFVVTHCDDFLTIHDCQGNTLSTIQNDGNFWYVATDQYGRIITSDCYNHCVKIFDTRGTLLQRFGESGYGDGCLQYPHGVCVDSSGKIAVADSLNHRICQFDKHGKFEQTILQGGDFYWPRGIATDVRGHIAVTWKEHVSVWSRSSGSHFVSTYL